MKHPAAFFTMILMFCLTVTAADARRHTSSLLSDVAIPLQTQDFPERPRPLIEIGDPFLGTGRIQDGWSLPTGAVWQPSLAVFGTYRSAFQTFSDGNDATVEWANRLDLFTNIYLTQTERILAGIRFLDKKGRFSGYTFKGPGDRGSDNAVNAIIRTLFFEGRLGELFPGIAQGSPFADLGFSVGRQPIVFQDGMLINDNIDAVGLTLTNLQFPGTVNLRSTLLLSNNEINRANLASDDSDTSLFGLFHDIDTTARTLEIDTVFVDSDATGDSFHAGIASTQRLGFFNSTVRVLGSFASGTETRHSRDGTLIYSELSWSPAGTHDHIYLIGFRAFDQFRSASRDPTAGGPLGRAGILFEAVGLGRYPAPLSNAADDAYGGSIGYQWFSDDTRRQVIWEIGGRYGTEADGQRAAGSGLRFQTALGQRSVFVADSFAVYDPPRSSLPDRDSDMRYGGRVELQVLF